jgi:hypothetical protein
MRHIVAGALRGVLGPRFARRLCAGVLEVGRFAASLSPIAAARLSVCDARFARLLLFKR